MAALVGTYTGNGALTRRYAGPEGKSFLQATGTLVVTSAGGTNVGEIPASLFGLNTFVGVTVFTKSDSTVVVIGAPDGTNGKSLITTAGSSAAADLPAATYTVTTQGISA